MEGNKEPQTFTFDGTEGKFACNLKCRPCAVINRTTGERCPRITCYHLPYCYYHLRKVAKLDIRPSTIPNAGFGLFTLRNIQEGSVIVPYIGDLISEDELNRRYGPDTAPYAVEIKRKALFVDSACKRGAGSFANHGSLNPSKPGEQPANAVFRKNTAKREAFLEAVVDIPAGSEILVDYQESYWDTLGRPFQTSKPGAFEWDPTDPFADEKLQFAPAPGQRQAQRHPATSLFRGCTTRKDVAREKQPNGLTVLKALRDFAQNEAVLGVQSPQLLLVGKGEGVGVPPEASLHLKGRIPLPGAPEETEGHLRVIIESTTERPLWAELNDRTLPAPNVVLQHELVPSDNPSASRQVSFCWRAARPIASGEILVA